MMHNIHVDWHITASHLNEKVLQFLSGRKIDHMLVKPASSLKQLFVQKVEGDSGSSLGVDWHSKMIGISRGNTHMT